MTVICTTQEVNETKHQNVGLQRYMYMYDILVTSILVHASRRIFDNENETLSIKIKTIFW